MPTSVLILVPWPPRRNGSEKTVSVTIGKMPNEKVAQNKSSKGNSDGGAPLGLTVVPADTVAGQGSRGVVVTDVNPDGPAAESGIRTGDVILDVSGKAVDKPSEVRQAVADARSADKRTILMRVESGIDPFRGSSRRRRVNMTARARGRKDWALSPAGRETISQAVGADLLG